jgi:hypothetical protein
MTTILLSDNGSTQPNATIKLRQLSGLLSDIIGQTVHPVSLQHANKIPVEKIGGTKANVFNEFMAEKLSEGNRDYILLPLFFGNSKALTKFVPDEKTRLEEKYGEFEIQIAKPVYPLPEGDARLAKILADHVKQSANGLRNIVLVDHGSPVPRVTAVREHLANSVQDLLGDEYQVAQACMERREGKEYDFNGQLLEDWLNERAVEKSPGAVVAMMFFLPGRHAGEGGDIAEICQSVMDKNPGFKVSLTPLIAEHPDFASLLEERYKNLITAS